jgi:AcrR family transcriptional regulator
MSSRPRSLERRRTILRAALECFAGLGYDATTLEDIRSRSGASTGSIYHQFSGKEELAAAVYLEGLRDYQQGLLAELARHRRAAGGIRAIVRYHLAWVARQPDWARYLVHMRHTESVAATEPAIRELNGSFLEGALAWLRPRIERGELRRLPTELFIALALGPAQELARLWLSGRTQLDLTRATRLLADEAWRSLRKQEDST